MTQVTDADKKVADEICKAVGAIYDDTPAYEIIARHRTASTAALTAEIQRLREDMGWFSGKHRLSLEHYSPMYGDDDDQSIEWRVHRESGSINDREWEIVGRGETALAAIQSARAAISTPSEVSEPVADESGGEGETARQIMVKFYASQYYNPQAARHADTVEAAIQFTLDCKTPPKSDDRLSVSWEKLRFARENALEQKLRGVIAHATGGDLYEPDLSLNEISTAITRFRNKLWEQAKEVGAKEALAALNDGCTQSSATPPNPTNGDAVREALEALRAVDLARTTDTAKDWIRATKLTDMFIAKHGGAALNHGGTQG